MLRQLLFINRALGARRRGFSTLIHVLDNDTAPAVEQEAEEASPLPPLAPHPAGPPHAAEELFNTQAQPLHPFYHQNSVPENKNPRDYGWASQLSQASAEGDLAKCIQILQDRCERGLGVRTGMAFSEALRRLTPAQALQVYSLAKRWGVVPTSGMAVSVVRMYAALGMLHHVETAVAEMFAAGMRPHWAVFFHWAAVHADAGVPEGVAAAAKAAEEAGLEVTAHYQTMMVKALCVSGRPASTLTLLREIRDAGEVPPEQVWRALIHCQGTRGHAARAQALFDEMREAGIEPGPATWTVLINAYAECRLHLEAADTLAAMRAAGHHANTQTYTVLLKSCSHTGDAAAAKELVAQMKRDGLVLMVQNWGALITACAAAQDLEGAREALDGMRAEGVAAGVVHYTALLSAHRNAGDLSGGLGVLAEMDKAGVRPGRETLTEVIMLLGNYGLVAEAEEAFMAMKAEGFAPDQVAFNVLVGALLSNWVSADKRNPHSPLLLRADELFREGWVSGKTRPLLSQATRPDAQLSGSMIVVDLHCQGIWSAQLAVLGVLSELAVKYRDAESGSAPPPALLLITGQGLKRGKAPMRETVREMLRRMGVHARVARSNEGTVIVHAADVKKLLRAAASRGCDFDAFAWHRCLVDPGAVERALKVESRYPRGMEEEMEGEEVDEWTHGGERRRPTGRRKKRR